MQRQIFIVNAQIVDSNGALHILDGYPKSFDSKKYNNDVNKTQLRATSDFAEVWSAFCKREDRQLQSVILETVDGFQLDRKIIGVLEEVVEEDS